MTDLCKGCKIPERAEKLDPYESEYYFHALTALVIPVRISMLAMVSARRAEREIFGYGGEQW